MSDAAPALPKLLKALEPQYAQQLAAYLHRERYERGQTILVEGDTPAALYFVEQGLVRLVQVSSGGTHVCAAPSGPRRMPEPAQHPGGAPVPATLEAVADTRLAVLPASIGARCCRSTATLYRAVALQLASDLRQMADMVRELALHPVAARLARFLLAHATTPSAATRWTQEAIAASIGSVRDVVGRTLRGLMEEGVLRAERGQLLIVDRHGAGEHRPRGVGQHKGSGLYSQPVSWASRRAYSTKLGQEMSGGTPWSQPGMKPPSSSSGGTTRSTSARITSPPAAMARLSMPPL